MDHYLADLAKEHGARIEVGHPVMEREEISRLPRPAGEAANHFPRNVIVATGLHQDGFEVAHMPFEKLYGVFAKCRVPWQEARVTVYFDDYSPDYAFTCSVNGIAFGLIFNRHRPVDEWEAEKFRRQAVEEDGYPFRKWMPLGLPGEQGAAAPTAKLSNPRLFHEDLVLAGTLSGMMDPILFFGMHGAFISGKIAAMALDDPVAAEREFKRLNVTFKPVLLAKKLIDNPLFPRNVLMKYPLQLGLSMFPLYYKWAVKYAYMGNISGYGRY
jgi:flavin-dependent dehydrogenase